MWGGFEENTSRHWTKHRRDRAAWTSNQRITCQHKGLFTLKGTYLLLTCLKGVPNLFT